MLENARRQVLLVLITVAAGLACNFFLKPALGPDLQGGSQLIYEVPEESLEALTQGEDGVSADQIMEQTVAIILERVDPAGQKGITVARRGSTGILIELPWFNETTELERTKQRISSLGKLEMRVVAGPSYAENNVSFDLDEERKRLETWLNSGGRELVQQDPANIERFNENSVEGPIAFGALHWFPHIIRPRLDNGSAWDNAFFQDTQPGGPTPMGPATVRVFDDVAWNNGLLTEEMLARPEEDRQLVEYVAINMDEDHFRGEDLNPSRVTGTFDQMGRRAVSYETKGGLAEAYGDWSEKYLNDHSAIILNGVIRSAPYFVSRIPGRGQISGSFTEAEVEELVKVLRTGSLKVKPQLLSDLTVGETLGADSITRGVYSLIAGGVAVFLFMLWYYRLAGIVACISLSLNMFLLWSALLFMQATITLPGLGGIVLTIGMAVDANVLIYERIREEFEKGKDMIRAVRAGFERAMSAILDSNITTFLTGIVLFNVGVGPVRGFAVTLMVGIVMTVFTQFFVTRLVFHFLIESDKLKNFHVRRLFAQPKFDYLKAAKLTVSLRTVVIIGLLAFAYSVPSEKSMGIDFKGGANMRMLVKEPTDPQTIRDRLENNDTFNSEFGSFSVNIIREEGGDSSTSHQFNIRVKLTDEMRDQIEVERAAWRKLRDEAESNDQPPPAPYQAPYLVQMREIFGDLLVDEASSDEKVIEGPQGNGYAMIELHLQAPVNLAEAQNRLDANKLPDAKVTVIGDEEATQGKDLLVQFTTSKNTPASGLLVMAREALTGLKTVDGNNILLSNPFPEAEEIQGRMVGELRNNAIGALILSWMLIIFYLRIRFHEYKYGVAAICALVHDVLIAFGVVVAINSFDLVYAEINLTMIACFLTIIGYSVNDTIVIFDRIRENVRNQANMGGSLTYRQLINLSVNQTMSRTILTTALTLFVVLAQFFVNWGTQSELESFAFGMFIGMISGTYSTIFIAAPVLVWMHDRTGGDEAMLAEQAEIREAAAAKAKEAKAELPAQ